MQEGGFDVILYSFPEEYEKKSFKCPKKMKKTYNSMNKTFYL